MEWLNNLDPILQALVATLFTWGMTALGAAVVFFFKSFNRKLLDMMMGFAAGVMIAASYWSLLNPAIEMASEEGTIAAWIPAASGFLLGGFFIMGMDKILPHLHIGFPRTEAEGIETNWHRSILLVSAITLHNIPEGLAVGVAFGAAAQVEGATLAGAVALAIGIGIQNFPEGLSVAVPLRREGFSRIKSFNYGQLSGMVEPVSGVLGAAAVILIKPILPYALSFAAGAMIFVVVEELIPESQLHKNTDLATLGTLIGFTIMMILDVAFG
jgi:zinc transporter, ZIP family